MKTLLFNALLATLLSASPAFAATCHETYSGVTPDDQAIKIDLHYNQEINFLRGSPLADGTYGTVEIAGAITPITYAAISDANNARLKSFFAESGENHYLIDV